MDRTNLIVAGAFVLLAAGAYLLLTAVSTPWPEDHLRSEEPPPLGEGPEYEHRELEVRDLSALFPGDVLRAGNPASGGVALTFDDGPDGIFTPLVLDILKAHDVKATFFVIGSRVDEFPEVAARIAEEGHAIGNHGYSHLKMSNLTPRQIRDELARADHAIYRSTGQRPRLFRPPYGALDSRSAETIIEEGYTIVLWNVDSTDWRGLKRDEVLANVLPHLRSGAIVLQHSAGGPGQDLTGTLEALPRIIRELRGTGLQALTVPEILGLPASGER